MANQVNFLIVEDDKADQRILLRTFQKLKIANPVYTAGNGLEALGMLKGEPGFTSVAAPRLVLLDLNMPKMNGIQFLEEIRDDPDLANTIVFVLTSSKRDEDKVAAYRNFVSGYIVKSNAGEGFRKAIEMIDTYWRIVELP